MKIGVIAVGRDCADALDQVLAPWLDAMARHSIHICLLSATFKEMEQVGMGKEPDRATVARMEELALTYPSHISSVAFTDYATEAEVREKGRQVLMARDVAADLIWLLDLSDEFYTVEQIDRIVAFVARSPLVAWYRLSFRNYCFDRRTYLVKSFQPPRIWRTICGAARLAECSYDNDFLYSVPTVPGQLVPDKAFPSLTVPPAVSLIRHDSWISNERSRCKVAYQERHFAHGAGCSFAWDDSKGGLIWNEEHFRRVGQPLPEIARE